MQYIVSRDADYRKMFQRNSQIFHQVQLLIKAKKETRKDTSKKLSYFVRFELDKRIEYNCSERLAAHATTPTARGWYIRKAEGLRRGSLPRVEIWVT